MSVRQAMPVQSGRVIDYTNSGEAIAAGDVVPLVSFCGIAEDDIAEGATGAVALDGVWEIAADNSAEFKVGDLLYWDADGKKLTKTADKHVLAGVCVAAKESAGTLAKVKIGFIAAPAGSASVDLSSYAKADLSNVTGTLPYAHGGTGLTTLGTEGQALVTNSGATAMEWKTVGGDV